METKKGNNVVIVILVILLIISVGYIGYDKMLKGNKANEIVNNDDTNSKKENVEDTNETSDNKPSINEEDNESSNKDGKIYIKKDGKLSLENVPTDLAGTYENKDGDSYFTLNSNGTCYISEGNGDSNDHGGVSNYDENNCTFQITYISDYGDDIFLELYPKGNNGWVASTFRLGKKDGDGKYSFATLEHTPVANAYEFVYIKK